MSINGDDFVKSFKWLRDHCVRDHSDEPDEGDDMFDGYGDAVGYGDDDFDYLVATLPCLGCTWLFSIYLALGRSPY